MISLNSSKVMAVLYATHFHTILHGICQGSIVFRSYDSKLFTTQMNKNIFNGFIPSKLKFIRPKLNYLNRGHPTVFHKLNTKEKCSQHNHFHYKNNIHIYIKTHMGHHQMQIYKDSGSKNQNFSFE